MIYNQSLTLNERDCADLLGQVFPWTMCEIFNEKDEDFSKVYQIYKLEITRNMNTKQK